tara:strand:+ start:1801 stop:1971 length:171 start_codon:yes stop_codon:yes gene_type:complete
MTPSQAQGWYCCATLADDLELAEITTTIKVAKIKPKRNASVFDIFLNKTKKNQISF